PRGSAQHVDDALGDGLSLRRPLRHLLAEFVRPRDQRLRQQMVLRGEVAVDGAERDTGGLRDVAHLHRVVATLRPQLERGVDDPAAPCGLALRQRARRRRRDLPVAHGSSTRGSRGRPSTRSPTMLRWISSVPPPIDDCTALIHFCWKMPSTSASGWSSWPYGPCMPIARSPSCLT